MEIIIAGPGQVTICFVDSSGKTLLQERLRSGGSPSVAARRPVSLLLHTHRGHVEVAPVLVDRGEKQQVTFDGDEPAAFTRRRCREIGCTDGVADEAARGQAQLLRIDPARPPGQIPERP
jgi:hypothetical protein